MSKSRGLFDEQFRLEKLTQKNVPLEKRSAHIDFEYFRKTLSVLRDAEIDISKGGRPSYDEVLMFKILTPQRYYNISEDNTKSAILDRLSFMRFLGLGINVSARPIPSCSTCNIALLLLTMEQPCYPKLKDDKLC